MLTVQLSGFFSLPSPISGRNTRLLCFVMSPIPDAPKAPFRQGKSEHWVFTGIESTPRLAQVFLALFL